MASLFVSCRLPVGVYLPSGPYGENTDSALSIISEVTLEEERPGVRARAYLAPVTVPDNLDAEGEEKFKRKQANILLRRVNALIRWYRHVTKSALIAEMTLVQASPVHFEEGSRLWGIFEADAAVVGPSRMGISEDEALEIDLGYGAEKDPPTESILLLDAAAALHGGRFREAVLLSWSAIDSTFNIFYNFLADRQLAGDWSEGIKFVKGVDFGLRQKMSVGLRLLGCRSLFGEPEEFWNRLSESYSRRNKIIHEGQLASEDDARSSVGVAEELVEKVRRLAEEQNIVMAS